MDNVTQDNWLKPSNTKNGKKIRQKFLLANITSELFLESIALTSIFWLTLMVY